MNKPNPSRSEPSGRLLRFRGPAAFREHRRSAQRFETSFFTAFVTAGPAWRFAVVASKTRIGGAVERNRAKRRLRAAFAAAQSDSPAPLEVVLHAKNAALTADFAPLRQSLSQIFCEVAAA